LLMFSFTGCSDKKPEAKKANIQCRIDDTPAPEWVCAGASIEDTITAVGSAPLSKLGEAFSLREAMANARSNLAQQIQTSVKKKVGVFSRSSGIGGTEAADKVSAHVSKQVAKAILKGSKELKQWQNENTKELYALVGVSENTLNKEIKDRVTSSYKKDDALWQQFQSKQAAKSLEQAFPSD
jgi:hypothetical protein